LEKLSGNLYVSTESSGEAVIGHPGMGKAGTVSPSSHGNVQCRSVRGTGPPDHAQTSYQACSRAFTVTKDMLEVLVNMK
jgi:flagellar hook protein FlgE